MASYESLHKKRLQLQIVSKRKSEKRFYDLNIEERRKVKRLAALKLRNYIKTVLGNKCFICGSHKRLLTHHMSYNPSRKSRKHPVTLKDLKEGRLVLLCFFHHRAFHYVQKMMLEGLFPKMLILLNQANSEIELTSISVKKTSEEKDSAGKRND